MGLSRNIYEEEEVAKVADPVVEKFGLCELKPKMSWPTVEACREFFVTMAIKHRFSFRQVRNDKFRVILVCKEPSYLLNLVYERRELSMELVKGDVVPNVYFMTKKRELRHHWYEIKGVSDTEYLPINNKSGKRYNVDLQKFECSCIEWKMSGIPCAHAVAVIRKKRVEKWSRYCSPYFSVEAFRRTYANYLYPLENIEDWEEIQQQHQDAPMQQQQHQGPTEAPVQQHQEAPMQQQHQGPTERGSPEGGRVGRGKGRGRARGKANIRGGRDGRSRGVHKPVSQRTRGLHHLLFGDGPDTPSTPPLNATISTHEPLS
ncbi:hypothetical protein IFM89_027342 [Coptis chinensis]|uniref:SWIM-type domain-containing protein n=1 Tax=Coptis chinensis TaxID=261450 RepID=A0A835LBV2_9MAGN|nr:hypothetical protein IFM89_027342 [Coptis chinensis]